METYTMVKLNAEGKHIFMSKYKEGRPYEHKHDFFEIEYILSGKGIHKVNGIEYKVSAGDVFFTNCDTPHAFYSNKDNEIIVYNCVFPHEFMENANIDFTFFPEAVYSILYNSVFPEEIRSKSYIKVTDKRQKIKKILDIMYQEFSDKEEGHEKLLSSYFISLLLCLFMEYKRQIHDDIKVKARHECIFNVLEHISINYTKEWTLNELAKIALLNPSYLSKKFKSVVGISISDYIQEIRIKKACLLLCETDKSFMQIANELGYEDGKFFRKIFKEKIGITPLEYRKSNQ